MTDLSKPWRTLGRLCLAGSAVCVTGALAGAVAIVWFLASGYGYEAAITAAPTITCAGFAGVLWLIAQDAAHTDGCRCPRCRP